MFRSEVWPSIALSRNSRSWLPRKARLAPLAAPRLRGPANASTSSPSSGRTYCAVTADSRHGEKSTQAPGLRATLPLTVFVSVALARGCDAKRGISATQLMTSTPTAVVFRRIFDATAPYSGPRTACGSYGPWGFRYSNGRCLQ